MRDRCAIRTFVTGTLDVDVDPLIIAGGVGERIHAFLIDSEPPGNAELLADGLNGLLDR
jgi:hypothetical protein